MKPFHRQMLWGAAMFGVALAAWIYAWHVAPFPGWDYIFYALLLAFLPGAYIFSCGAMERTLAYEALFPPAPPAGKKKEWWMIDPSIETVLPPEPGPRWRAGLMSALRALSVIAIGIGMIYSLILLRTDTDWFLGHVAGPEGIYLLAFVTAQTRMPNRWRKEGKQVADDW